MVNKFKGSTIQQKKLVCVFNKYSKINQTCITRTKKYAMSPVFIVSVDPVRTACIMMHHIPDADEKNKIKQCKCITAFP